MKLQKITKLYEDHSEPHLGHAAALLGVDVTGASSCRTAQYGGLSAEHTANENLLALSSRVTEYPQEYANIPYKECIKLEA